EIELLVEVLDGIKDLTMAEMRIVQRGDLRGFVRQKIDFLVVEAAVFLRLFVEEGARIGRRERNLDRVGIDLLGEIHGLLDRLLRLPGEAQDERAVYADPELVAILREGAREFHSHALLDVEQDLL